MASSTTTVSGDFVQDSFELLPLAGERARAAIYFSHQVSNKSSDENLELARWYLRASLSEFRSVFDLVAADLKSNGLSAHWRKSSQKALLEGDPVIAILRKVRDFAIHSSIVVCQEKTFKVTSTQAHARLDTDIRVIVIEALDRAVLAKGRGKDELREFDDGALSIFNQNARQWPADLLIQIAIYRTSEFLGAFLSANRQSAN